MKRILSIFAVIAMLITMCAAITLPAVADDGELVNLFDLDTAFNGTVSSTNTRYYTTDYIDVVPGDVLYFGINDVTLSYQLYLYTADSNSNSNPVTSPLSNKASEESYRLCEVVDSFSMPDSTLTWGIMSYTIPEGFTRVRVSCRSTFADQYLLTKNQPFTNAERMEFFGLHFTSIYTIAGDGLWNSAGTKTDGRDTYKSANKITVEAGDKIYFGPCRTNQGFQIYHWDETGATTTVKHNSANLKVVGRFESGDVLYCYTAPQAGTLGMVCYYPYFDTFVITKNEEITVDNFFAYWETQNPDVDLSRVTTLPTITSNKFTAASTKGYYAADGTITSSSDYYSGTAITVEIGDIIYFGPVNYSATDSSQNQTIYLYDWHGSDTTVFTNYTEINSTTVTTNEQIRVVDTFPNGQAILAYEVMAKGRVGLVNAAAYNKMFFAAKNVRMTEQNFYDYWDLHSEVCGTYSQVLGRYDHVVPKESVLNGKTALFCGDSITAAAADDDYFNGWPGRMKTFYGMERVLNNGTSGAALSTTRDNYQNAATSTSKQHGRIYWQITKEKDYQYDYVILHGGVNDAWDSAPVGEISDSFELEDFDLTTYAGGLEAAIYYAVKYQPQAAIGYIINFASPTKTTGNIANMGEIYFELGKKICDKWGISYLDLYSQLNGDNFDLTIYANQTKKDLIHPNAAGYNIIAPYIGDWMEKLEPYSVPTAKENDKTVIACVGDSLTKGEKSGDVNRYSYPAFLQEMMGDEYEVMNFGWGGAAAQTTASNTYKATVQYNRSIDANPDKVVIMLGANDAKSANWDSANPAVSCAAFKKDLKALAEEYLALPSKPTVYLAKTPWSTGEFRQTAYTTGGLLDAVEEVATELGLKVIDAYTPTVDMADTLFASDGTHLNPAGYELIAGEVYKVLTDSATAPDVVSITEKDTSVDETNEEKPLIRNWAAYYDTATAFRIETIEDVEIFGDLLAAGYTFAGKTVYLEKDLDFTGINFKPLGGSTGESGNVDDYKTAFAGTFDGQNHVFSNVNISSLYYNVALFPVCNGATIKNFGLDGGRIEGFSTVASFIGRGHNAPKLYNIWSSADVYSAYRAGTTAGIMSYCRKNDATTDAEIINVAYYGNVDGTSTIGGICADLGSSTIVENVVFGGTVTQRAKHSGGITPFSVYSSFSITGATSGLYTVDTAEERNTSAAKNDVITLTNSFSTVPPVKFAAEDFTNGAFAYYMNNLDGNDTKWIMKHGYAVPWGDENTAIIKIKIDNKEVYSNENSGIPADILAKGSYWYNTDGKVYSSEIAKTWIFNEGDAIKIGVSAAGGDFNNTGMMDTADVVMLLRYVDLQTVEGMNDTLADVNADGTVTLFDAIKLLQVINDLTL